MDRLRIDSDLDSEYDSFEEQPSSGKGNDDSSTSSSNNFSFNNNITDRDAARGASEKEAIVTKYADKIKTEPFKKGPQITKDRANRATVEQVLDPRTLRFLGKIFNSDLMSRINGCISTGKEANVYHGTHDDPENNIEFAVKIFKTSILVFKDRKRYVDGDFRLRNSKDQGNPRKMVKIWAEKEFRNLNRIYQSQVPCPKPYVIKSHVLVMEFLTKGDGQPSPKLKDYLFNSQEEVYRFYKDMLLCIRRLFVSCRLVHADLSEYNSIVHDDKLYIIDVSQSVEPDHPMALDFLRMDIKNVNDFFQKSGIQVYSEKQIFGFVTATDKQLGVDTSDDASLEKYLKSLPPKTTTEQEMEDEVFRSLHLVRSLNQLDERDFQKFSEGKIDTMKELISTEKSLLNDEEPVTSSLSNKQVTNPLGNNHNDSLNTDEDNSGEIDSNSSSDDEGDNSDENDEHEDNEEGEDAAADDDDDDDDDGDWEDRDEAKPKGKKHEDKDEKKARKEAAKLAKQEKRKVKMKKHVKKKLVNKRKG